MKPLPGDPDAWSVRLVVGSDTVEESFVLQRGGITETVRLHDYARVYSIPGLYEHVVQATLNCRSPLVAATSLMSALAELGLSPDECRVLDLGAGNGIVGELLRREGVGHIVGVDSLSEAREACLRDRPGIYTSYEVADLGSANEELTSRLRHESLTALTCVGALGGGHVPPTSLLQAIEALRPGSLVVLTLHEKWLNASQPEGIGAALQSLFSQGHLCPLRSERFLHRFSTSGTEIIYVCIVATTT